MKSVTHQKQKHVWGQEHSKPETLLQIDSDGASFGVEHFIDWLTNRSVDFNGFSGLEMCCGKGRNAIWLARRGMDVTGADFSEVAIAEAERRAASAHVAESAHFIVHDATLAYDELPERFDFVIDCFGSTDIENAMARKIAADNLADTLKPGGYLVTYLLSSDDEYNQAMTKDNKAREPGSFVHPISGKFEKAFTEREVIDLHEDLKLLTLERIPKVFKDHAGMLYNSSYIWAVFQKP
jgi:SAM-dependent methyltransferase